MTRAFLHCPSHPLFLHVGAGLARARGGGGGGGPGGGLAPPPPKALVLAGHEARATADPTMR